MPGTSYIATYSNEPEFWQSVTLMTSESVFAAKGTNSRRDVYRCVISKHSTVPEERNPNFAMFPTTTDISKSTSTALDLRTTNHSPLVNSEIDSSTSIQLTKKKKYICPGCGKGLSHKYTLDRHIRTVCGKIRNPSGKWQCNCGRRYESSPSLVRHQRLECKVPPQFHCVFCNQSFSQKCSLTRHLKSLTCLKPLPAIQSAGSDL